MARIHVLFFAGLADAAGVRDAYVDVPDGEPVGELPARLVERYPSLRARCANVAYAVNAEYVTAEQPLSEGDEVALIPPVSGGC